MCISRFCEQVKSLFLRFYVCVEVAGLTGLGGSGPISPSGFCVPFPSQFTNRVMVASITLDHFPSWNRHYSSLWSLASFSLLLPWLATKSGMCGFASKAVVTAELDYRWTNDCMLELPSSSSRSKDYTLPGFRGLRLRHALHRDREHER